MDAVGLEAGGPELTGRNRDDLIGFSSSQGTPLTPIYSIG